MPEAYIYDHVRTPRGRGKAARVEKWFSHLKIVVAEQQPVPVAEEAA